MALDDNQIEADMAIISTAATRSSGSAVSVGLGMKENMIENRPFIWEVH